jgi:hypothetical protein
LFAVSPEPLIAQKPTLLVAGAASRRDHRLIVTLTCARLERPLDERPLALSCQP